MTKRWFYRDPLAAAWMAKHFGMRFVDEHDGESQDTELRYLALACAQPEKFCIHPDSVALLDPQIGDLVQVPFDGSTDAPIRFSEIVLVEYRDMLRQSMDYAIIQRTGTPFMWPELET